MLRLRQVLWPAGLALGLVAEWVAYDGEPALTAADGIVGLALIAAGLVTWERRAESGVGPIMTAAGFAWFLGTFGGWALYLHRGPLAHLVLSYPSGHARSRLERAAIIAAYAYAAIYPIAANDYATIGFSAGLVAVAGYRYAIAGGPERRARESALAAALAFALVLAFGAAAQLANADIDRTVLWTYDAVVLVVAVGLAVDLLYGRWARATVTGLVVDLGDPGSAGTLRERLAQALGDPTLGVGYFLPEEGRYVDELGRAFELPAEVPGRAVTPIDEDGTRVAALVHDTVVLDDPDLVGAVASATRFAVSNARLQAEVRARVAEVAASRRRIVHAADAQRRRLERELRDGAERRLARMAALLDECGPQLAGVRGDLDAARSQLREFARGIHPAILTEAGTRGGARRARRSFAGSGRCQRAAGSLAAGGRGRRLFRLLGGVDERGEVRATRRGSRFSSTRWAIGSAFESSTTASAARTPRSGPAFEVSPTASRRSADDFASTAHPAVARA